MAERDLFGFGKKRWLHKMQKYGKKQGRVKITSKIEAKDNNFQEMLT